MPCPYPPPNLRGLGLPDDIRALFVSLRRLLEGERGDDLWQGLPDPIANVIRDLLG